LVYRVDASKGRIIWPQMQVMGAHKLVFELAVASDR